MNSPGNLSDALGKLLRPGQRATRQTRRQGPDFPGFPREVRRPAVFSVLFWSALTITCVSWVLIRHDGEAAVGFVPMALSAGVLTAAWLVLPWDPRVSPRSKLAAPAFLAAMFLIGRTLEGSSVMFYPLAFANGVFLFRFRRGTAYAAVVLAAIFVDGLLIVRTFQSLPTGTSVAGNALAVTVLFVPVAVFVIGICSSIVEANRRREDMALLLEKLEGAHADLEEHAGRVRELAVSEERARMAREIHDTLGHHLTAISLQLEHARRSKHKDPEGAWQEVGESRELLSAALSEVRRAVRALKPLDLEERSGSGAMAALARSFEGAGPEISFEVEGKERVLPEEAELVLYRAMQEGLTNALKHSNARHIQASLSFTEEGVKLSVFDDGTGAPSGAMDRGFGLTALGDRADEQGGILSAGNVAGGGFLLDVTLPDNQRGT